jgi:cyclic-di-AMP phosphodiesterase PgpH
LDNLPLKQETVLIPRPRRPYLSIVGLGLVAALAAAVLMPRVKVFDYRYTEGRTWLYDDVVAPFDFMLTDDNSESALAKAIPYYTMDVSVAHQQKLQLAQIIQQQHKVSGQDAEYDDFNTNVGSYRSVATALLDEVFRRGIAKEKPTHRDAVLFNAASMQVPASTMLSLEEASEFLTDTLPYSNLRQPELLLPMLEKVLEINVFYSDSLTMLYGNGQSTPVNVVKKGTTIIQNGDRVDAISIAKLDALRRAYRESDQWLPRLGYALFAIVAFASLWGWLFFYAPEVFADKRQIGFIAGLILVTLALILACHYAGHAVPLLLPIYLLPLMLQARYSLKTAIVVWSVPVLLAGFALDWGMLWVSIQVAGAGVGLLLNDQVENWRDRILALVAIFAVQALVWVAALLANKADGGMHHTDVLVFLAIAALLSISRSVLVRFFRG